MDFVFCALEITCVRVLELGHVWGSVGISCELVFIYHVDPRDPTRIPVLAAGFTL